MTGNMKDFATGIVVTAPSPATSGTSLTLQTGEGSRMPIVPFSATAHPATEFPTLDNAERIEVTDVTGDVLTIVRAQGDTTAKSIAAGWRVSNALFLDNLEETDPVFTAWDKDYDDLTNKPTLPTRDSLGLNTDDAPQFAGVNIGHASDTTISRVSAGKIAVEGKEIIDASSNQTATNKVVTNVNASAPATPADGMLWWDTDDTNTTTGMLNSKVITATRDAAAPSGDVSYTGVGFVPTKITCYMNVDASLYTSEGISDSSKTSMGKYQSSANVWYATFALVIYSNYSGWYQQGVVKSYDADGFTLTWTKVGTPTAGTIKLSFVCER